MTEKTEKEKAAATTLLLAINAQFGAFLEDANKSLSGNKAAGTRSRRESSALTHMLKEWRKVRVVK